MEYRGGTYPSQVYAQSPYDALQRWSRSLDFSEIDYMGEYRYKNLLEVVNNPIIKPVEAENVENVWRWADIINGGSIWIHIILTKNRNSGSGQIK